jgi:hypothetical protein
MGGESRIGGSLMMSKNLANSAHIDIGDNSRGVCIWVEENPGIASNWYFVLPDVSFGGSYGYVLDYSTER